MKTFRSAAAAIAILVLWLSQGQPALAIPPFAAQTGQPCTACHIGGFGPQLTPVGRAFKIGGYTQDGGEGVLSHIPLALMAIGSFGKTNADQPDIAAPHYGRNSNFSLDQVNVFLAGRVNDHVGGFVQTTYDGVSRQFALDNTDLRLTTPLEVLGNDLRIGLSVNNNPTVQDPYNSTFAWIYPFVTSRLVPTPTAQPLLAGRLAGNSIGATVYAWYDRRLYLEAGGYNTFGPTLLRWTGTTLGPGRTQNFAPYGRAAYEWNWAGQSAHVGGLVLHANINPASGSYTADGSFGHDHYTDLAADFGYQFLGNGVHIATVDGIFTHEMQDLRGTTAMGGSSQSRNHLEQFRLNLAYWYKNTYGFNAAWQNTWGKANAVLYGSAPTSGSKNGKPNSNSFTLEADWVPFGKENSPFSPLANLKLGAQYTIYTRFNGGNHDYDGFGRNASDNNTLFLFAWLAF